MIADRQQNVRLQSIFAALYICIAILLAAVVAAAFQDILQHRDQVSNAAAMLKQLSQRPIAAGSQAQARQKGSAFLQSETLSLAGAALLQRVVEAVRQAGGKVVSSQVDVQGAQAKHGVVSLLISCEIDDKDLQKLLYDLEANTPFLFVERLSVSSAAAGENAFPGYLHVLLSVSGQWQRKS